MYALFFRDVHPFLIIRLRFSRQSEKEIEQGKYGEEHPKKRIPMTTESWTIEKRVLGFLCVI